MVSLEYRVVLPYTGINYPAISAYSFSYRQTLIKLAQGIPYTGEELRATQCQQHFALWYTATPPAPIECLLSF